jgi:hypothetical protein
MEELSAGQAGVLVRNEQEIDKAMAEMEELEEQLADSIRWAWRGRRREGGGGVLKIPSLLRFFLLCINPSSGGAVAAWPDSRTAWGCSLAQNLP